jgi:UDP-glucose 4-epimerase
VSWLVTGGAGYIGAHVVAELTRAGEQVAVLDDLSTGELARVGDVPFVEASVLDRGAVERTLRQHRVRGIVHVAGKKQVEESVHRPLYYYRENVEGLRALLEAATTVGVGSFVFSSSAAVYGAPDVDLVHEDVACQPVNPYGRTKLVCEGLLADVARATGLRCISLRYFNVAGAARPGLADRGTTNLVPMVFQRLTDRQPPLIFGDDFPTLDGTCIRDFVHVSDVATAHVAAARALAEGRVELLTANIGRGEGCSVRQMIRTIGETTGLAGEPWAQPVVAPRRAGDPPRVVAAVDRAREALGWQATHDVPAMVASAWAGWTARADLPA